MLSIFYQRTHCRISGNSNFPAKRKLLSKFQDVSVPHHKNRHQIVKKLWTVLLVGKEKKIK
jgi:hypothetical protein